MDLDPLTLGTFVGGVIAAIGGTIGVQRGVRARKGRRAERESGEGGAGETLVPRSAVQMEGRLVRIESKVDQVLDGQRVHAADDERRFASLEADISRTRHELKDRISPLPIVEHRVARLEDDLRQTRRDAGLDTSITRVSG